jgi:hypothetical protein
MRFNEEVVRGVLMRSDLIFEMSSLEKTTRAHAVVCVRLYRCVYVVIDEFKSVLRFLVFQTDIANDSMPRNEEVVQSTGELLCDVGLIGKSR